MNQAQFKQYSLAKACNHGQYTQHSAPATEDILVRMERLRALASVQNKRVKCASKQQFSFAF